jgi:hypothetical protein
VLLVPQIVSKYYARSSFSQLWRMYYQYGYFKPLTVLKLGGVMTSRQLVPALFVLSLIVTAPVYALLDLTVSACLCVRERQWLLPHLMAAFFIIHFSYGLGYLKGIWDFMVLKQHSRSPVKDLALSR